MDARRRKATPLDYRTCRRCGKTFIRRKGTPTKYCGARCAKRATNRRRAHRLRATGRADKFDLRDIAERDGWRCHICGKKVPDRPYAARHNDPTIDHLVPVAHGGTHTLDNVALAHNRCNWQAGDRGTAQLRLIG